MLKNVYVSVRLLHWIHFRILNILKNSECLFSALQMYLIMIISVTQSIDLIAEIMTSAYLKSARMQSKLMIYFSINLWISDNSRISLLLYWFWGPFTSMSLRNEIAISEIRFYRMCKTTWQNCVIKLMTL